MPRLQDWLVEALNRENLTITAAAKHSAFSLLDRQRLLTWQRKLYAEIEAVPELLLPAKASTVTCRDDYRPDRAQECALLG